MSSFTNRLVNFIQPKLNQRSVAFLLCLVLSSLFWLLTSLSEEYIAEVKIPVSYTNTPTDYLISNEPLRVIDAEVRGTGFDLLWYWLRLEKPAIKVNANPAALPYTKRNGRNYHYRLTNEKSGHLSNIKDNQLTLLSLSPDTIFLRFSPKYVKQVPVKLQANITYAKQYGASSSPQIEPDSITLIGPKELLDTISCVPTQPQQWNKLTESVTARINLQQFEHLPFVELSHKSVQVALNVVEFTEGEVMVPLHINAENPEAIKVFPKQVRLKYQVPLTAYDQVEASQFQASITFHKTDLQATTLPVSIDYIPESVKQVRVFPSQVEFIIQK